MRMPVPIAVGTKLLAQGAEPLPKKAVGTCWRANDGARSANQPDGDRG